MEQTDDAFSIVFNKVIKQSMESGNDGVMVDCCHTFFKRASKHHAAKHIGQEISVKVWCRKNQVSSPEDFRKYWKSKKLRGLPTVNEQNCLTKVEQLEKEIERLKSELKRKERQYENEMVDSFSLVHSQSGMSELQSSIQKCPM